MSSFTHTTREACAALRISDSTLRRLRRQGLLQPGVHYRALGSGLTKPSLLWDIEATDAAMAAHSAEILPGSSHV